MSKLKQLLFSLNETDRKVIEEKLKTQDQQINQLKQQLEELMLLLSKYEIEEHKPVYCTLAGTECEYLGKVEELKQQLAEKDNRIEFGREEIRKRNKRIDEIVERDKKLFDNKNKEIECLNKRIDRYENMFRSRINRTGDMQKDIELYINQLAIQKLEEVKELLLIESKNNPIIYDVNDDAVGGALDRDKTFEVIDQQIKELKGEKDVKD